jgi:hypothetical protein
VSEFCKKNRPRREEGAGNAGCFGAPAASCATRKAELVTTGTTETSAFPARQFTTYARALPGVRDLIVTVVRRSSSANLAPAQGRQDHTISPSALAALVARASSVHRIPRPALVTIAKRPSRARDGHNVRLIWPFLQSRRPATDWHDGQFAHDGYAQFSLGLSGKSVRRTSPM